MANIGIIIGSTRPERFGTQIAEWLHKLAAEHKEHKFSLVDIAEFNLPLLDEPKPALGGEYSKDHTKKWSAEIAQYDGYVIVSPEYNHGVGPALKNAIDFLYHEWVNKPVAFVGYGANAGGARAIEHLRGIAGQVQWFDIAISVIIPQYWGQLDEAGTWQPTEQQTSKASALLGQTGFWADKFAPIRAELAASKQA